MNIKEIGYNKYGLNNLESYKVFGLKCVKFVRFKGI